ncbi:MAG TPA: VWA domain-containing protein, partial [Candidatus Eremiobacteraceae bacterium]|nr:VWA domain-containing protein [Candidatus Eremiobacteraceae bacterium]
MRLRSTSFVLLVYLPLFAAKLDAQIPATSPPSQTSASPALRATTRLVEVNVVVTDKNGHPVKGLKKENFTLRDQGQLQDIAIFYGEPDKTAAAATRTAPNVFTNRLADSGQQPGNMTVILFDSLNTAIQDQQFARDQVIKVLRRLSPNDHVAIYLLTTQLRILHDFTFDLKALLHAVNQFSGSAALPLQTDVTRIKGEETPAGRSPNDFPANPQESARFREFMQESENRYGDFMTVNRAETTVNALEAIAAHLARFPGRKSLVWISGGFPLVIGMPDGTIQTGKRDLRNLAEEVQRATRVLNQFDIAVYPVDARGLLTSSIYSGQTRADAPAPSFSPDQDNFAAMDLLAQRTGGKAFYNMNDVEGATRFALNDGDSAYTLSFYPTHGDWHGKYHELKVALNVPGAQVRYRKGYFAAAEPENREADTKAAIDTAVWSPIESTALFLEVRAIPLQPAASRALELKIGMDARELWLAKDHERWAGALDIAYAQIGDGDKAISFELKHLNLNLEKKTFDALLQQGMVLTHALKVVPGATVVRVVVRDSTSGAVGSLT